MTRDGLFLGESFDLKKFGGFLSNVKGNFKLKIDENFELKFN